MEQIVFWQVRAVRSCYVSSLRLICTVLACEDDNKSLFVELLATHLMTGSIQHQLEAFKRGLSEFVSLELLASWISPLDLSDLISGPDLIIVAEWRSSARYSGGITAPSLLSQWFWNWVENASEEERRALLRFATGKGGVPAAGFNSLNPRFTLAATMATTDSLPVAHTCNHELTLPHYPTEELLQQKLQLAINSSTSSRELRFELA